MKLLFVCSASISSSFFAQSANDYANKNNIDIHVDVAEINSAMESAHNYKLIVLSPQVQYAHKRIQEDCPTAKVVTLPTELYLHQDAAHAITFIKENFPK